MDINILKKAIGKYLQEDIGSGDLTSEATIAPEQVGIAEFVAKENFVVCGIESIAPLVFTTQNSAIEIVKAVKDKTQASPGDILLTAKGPVLDLLKAERVALNLVQRLCGIATYTLKFVEKVKPLPVRILDTRKTTPGMRMLEKYAVRTGGGYNHRYNLADGVLIKDNHIQACGSIKKAVTRMREHVPHTMKIEVEAANMDQVRECLTCSVDIIMLDNMEPSMMRDAVKLVGGKARLEASGGINLDNVREVAETGVDYISIGALTHSAPAIDISMRLKNI
ncbi:MAG: carboxylating nicotinate-nucleotide diphosphorylase [Deltaproteobacteria bacterium]|jgi:nicotinate-nucleotide pyrophosphorylase (carboxylating)|nr:carboxylating nicotinate-nucleotide diphosphorylase [Deltaproteobacteria bacterium]